jgi:hypothetical protein
MKRRENFNFRISPEERSIIAVLALQERRTPSEYLRELVRREASTKGLDIQKIADEAGSDRKPA